MSRHHLDIAIASDLSQLVLERRYRRDELTTPALDSSNQKLYALPSHLVGRERFLADRDDAVEPIYAVGHFHHGRKGQR